MSAFRLGREGLGFLQFMSHNIVMKELSPLPNTIGKPRVGAASGEFVVPDSFFEPLPDEILKGFSKRVTSSRKMSAQSRLTAPGGRGSVS
jgi:hypothetical protein